MDQAIITIDGSSASGKSSLCRRLASQWEKWDWLSTGVFYRGLAYMILDCKIENDKSQWVSCLQTQPWKVQKTTQMTDFFYKNKNITRDIYNESIDQTASQVAVHVQVRQALIPHQREQKDPHRGLIAEGRDCGTVIFPSAPMKIYLTAKDEIRAERRAKERNQSPDWIRRQQKKRDQTDSQRLCSPLKKPQSAWTIHSDQYSLDEIEKMVNQRACRVFSQFI